jgi:hypothetical protein
MTRDTQIPMTSKEDSHKTGFPLKQIIFKLFEMLSIGIVLIQVARDL